MTKICFVSYEIHPTVKGGCGVLLSNTARYLLPQGHEIIFLLYVSDDQFRQFNEVDRLDLPHPQNCQAYQVQALARDARLSQKNFRSIFEYRAYQFHYALKKIYQLQKPEIVEFFDYCGIGYEAINSKLAGLGYLETHLSIRLHGALELIDQQQPGNIHGMDRYIMYGMEHHALRLAETILYPSTAFLEKTYQPNYEPWLGNKIFSQPALVDRIEPVTSNPEADIILFYGRLHGIKGVDIFVDAAILYLMNPSNPPRSFYLVGYDSYLPPGASSSYQVYLRRKIPTRFQNHFQFTGQLSRQELEVLLPKVLFAVIPSYFESFCYAAHELYEARIPLIVADIPAFEDYFHHHENALVFDGTVSELSEQMELLSKDKRLRERITRPYLLNQNPLGNFYTNPQPKSWIVPQKNSNLPTLCICILGDHQKDLEVTLQSLKPILNQTVKLIFLYPVQKNKPVDSLVWFLGKLYTFNDEQGKSIHPTQVLTEETLLILKAGDQIDPSFILTGLKALQNHTNISYVGCWKKRRIRGKTQIATLPLDAVIELAPFIDVSLYSRFLLRTPASKLLIDLFDPRAGALGELDYLLKLDNETNCGIMIPEILMSCKDQAEIDLSANTLDYLFSRDHNWWRKKRMAKMILTLSHRSKTLRKHFYSENMHLKIHYLVIVGTKRLIKWFVQTKPGNWFIQKSGLKRLFYRTIRGYSILGPDKGR